MTQSSGKDSADFALSATEVVAGRTIDALDALNSVKSLIASRLTAFNIRLHSNDALGEPTKVSIVWTAPTKEDHKNLDQDSLLPMLRGQITIGGKGFTEDAGFRFRDELTVLVSVDDSEGSKRSLDAPTEPTKIMVSLIVNQEGSSFDYNVVRDKAGKITSLSEPDGFKFDADLDYFLSLDVCRAYASERLYSPAAAEGPGG